MILRRLSKKQKAEILEAFTAGESASVLAGKYSCATATINRTVKTLLSTDEYKLLKGKRSKISKGEVKKPSNEIENKQKDCFLYSSSSRAVEENVNDSELSIESDYELTNTKLEENNNSFELIEPLVYSFDFDEDKLKIGFELLDFECLPESVYMIVDKKVELDLQLISDLPEWSFLPENELQRNAILLFTNQRSAKRSCSKNQRVIKIPNTSIFKLSKSYLISKGITRLILEDSIIGLDK